MYFLPFYLLLEMLLLSLKLLVPVIWVLLRLAGFYPCFEFVTLVLKSSPFTPSQMVVVQLRLKLYQLLASVVRQLTQIHLIVLFKLLFIEFTLLLIVNLLLLLYHLLFDLSRNCGNPITRIIKSYFFILLVGQLVSVDAFGLFADEFSHGQGNLEWILVPDLAGIIQCGLLF